MATSLAEIRAKLKSQESRSERTGGGDNAIYPHWNIPKEQRQQFVSCLMAILTTHFSGQKD